MTDQPILPYPSEDGTTSGFAAGVATSEERAREADTDDTTNRRQQITLDLLGDAGTKGLTWGELSDIRGYHHGQASGVLSNLHKAGKIARLTERRGRSFVYVLPEYVNGRDTQPQGRTQQATYTRADLAAAWAVGYDAGWQDSDEDTNLGNVNPYLDPS